MTNQVKERIAKIYELVRRGATDGERQAAKSALDRLVSKYNLDFDELQNIHKKAYTFKYSSDLEHWLLAKLMICFVGEEARETAYRQTFDTKTLQRCKQIIVTLTYQDFITLDCAYEYFRRHMKIQWKKTCAHIVAKCRTTRTKAKKRTRLQNVFFDQYAIASGLIDSKDVGKIDTSSLSKEEYKNLMALIGLEGGQYREQMTGGLMLAEKNEL